MAKEQYRHHLAGQLGRGGFPERRALQISAVGQSWLSEQGAQENAARGPASTGAAKQTVNYQIQQNSEMLSIVLALLRLTR